MRRFTFRGQDEDGKWLYGDLRQRIGYWPAIIESYCTDEGKVGYREIAVKEETVGRLTPLKDKNGKDIYEGDILRSPLGNIVAVEFGYKEHIVKHGRPYITDSFACYGWIARNVKNGITDFFDNEFAAGEVIGNIYDNPELLNKKLSV